MLHSRSRNSYMMSPRSVTAQPIGMPLRILKFAMDFFARVMIGFCPVIWPSSCAAVSSSLTFWLASPRPMFTVILESFGTAMTFVRLKRFISAGVVSFRYFSCILLFISVRLSSLLCTRFRLLVQSRSATLANPRSLAVRQHVVADTGVLAAAPANNHHVRRIDSSLFFHDAALDVLRRIRASVALDDVGVFHDHRVLSRIDGKHAAGLARIAPAHHLHLVAFANLNPDLFCCLCAHFLLPVTRLPEPARRSW